MIELRSSTKFLSLDVFVICTTDFALLYCPLSKGLIMECWTVYLIIPDTVTRRHSLCRFWVMGRCRRVGRQESVSTTSFPAQRVIFTHYFSPLKSPFQCGKGDIIHKWTDLFKIHQTIKSLMPCQNQVSLKKRASWSNGFTCRNIFFPEFKMNELCAIWPAYPIFLFWALIHNPWLVLFYVDTDTFNWVHIIIYLQ